MMKPSTPASRRALRLADLSMLRFGKVPGGRRRYPLIRFTHHEQRALRMQFGRR